MELLVKLAQDGARAMEVDEIQDLAADQEGSGGGGGVVADPGADMFADASGAAEPQDEAGVAEKGTGLGTTTVTSPVAGGELIKVGNWTPLLAQVLLSNAPIALDSLNCHDMSERLYHYHPCRSGKGDYRPQKMLRLPPKKCCEPKIMNLLAVVCATMVPQQSCAMQMDKNMSKIWRASSTIRLLVCTTTPVWAATLTQRSNYTGMHLRVSGTASKTVPTSLPAWQ
jgi:hypothetical protein